MIEFEDEQSLCENCPFEGKPNMLKVSVSDELDREKVLETICWSLVDKGYIIHTTHEKTRDIQIIEVEQIRGGVTQEWR